MNPVDLLLAFLLDLAVGDPPRMPHPVVLLGRLISRLEALLRRFGGGPAAERLAGVILAVAVVGGTYLATAALLTWAGRLSALLERALQVWLVAASVAARGLAGAARAVYEPLVAGDLPAARRNLAMIVGRDTAALPPEEVLRGAVETVAENTVDGVVSPLFYALLGGAPLAMAFKAVSTLDSMVGYRNERYRWFGWASARLDDAANYLPARLTGLLMAVAARLLGLDARRALLVVRRDAAKHPSPNGGIPEAAVAGALGVRLGGLNYYDGRPSFRAHLGDALRPLAPADVLQAVRIMYITSALALVLGVAASAAFGLGSAATGQRAGPAYDGRGNGSPYDSPYRAGLPGGRGVAACAFRGC